MMETRAQLGREPRILRDIAKTYIGIERQPQGTTQADLRERAIKARAWLLDEFGEAPPLADRFRDKAAYVAPTRTCSRFKDREAGKTVYCGKPIKSGNYCKSCKQGMAGALTSVGVPSVLGGWT